MTKSNQFVHSLPSASVAIVNDISICTIPRLGGKKVRNECIQTDIGTTVHYECSSCQILLKNYLLVCMLEYANDLYLAC